MAFMPVPAVRLALAGLILLAVAGCGGSGSSGENRANPPSAAGYAPFTYTTGNFEKTEGDCGAPGSPCGRVAIHYPRIGTGGDDSTRVRLNRLVDDLIVVEGFETDSTRSFDTLADHFLGEYRRAREKFPGAASTAEWTLEITVTPLFDAPGIWSLQLLEYLFSGGAHPNTISVLRSFRTADGSPILLEDIVRPDAMAALAALGERRFREIREIPEGTSLKDAGFFTDTDGLFHLPDNLAVTDDGLRFFYNSYEIAPHSSGPTGMLLSWSEVGGFLRPGTAVADAAARRGAM